MELVLISVVIGLISMIAYGLANAFSKPIAQKLGPAQALFLRGFTIVAIMTLASIPSYHLLGSHWPVALATVVLGILGYLPVLAFTHGIKESPLGVVTPIAGTASLITVVLAFLFLKAELSPGQWVAIVLVIAANIAVSVDMRTWRNSNLLRRSSGIPFAVAAAVGWGLFFFFFVPASQILGPWLATLLAEIGVTLAAGVHAFRTRAGVNLRDMLRRPVVLNGILISIGTAAFAIGVAYANVAIVAALSNSTALIATLLGVWLYREHLGRKEKIAGAFMIAGVAAMPFL